MEKLLTPKAFLKFGGIAFLVIGFAGYFGVTGVDQSLFGSFWRFSSRESLLHMLLGIAGVIAIYTIPKAQTQRQIVGIFTGLAFLRIFLFFFPALGTAFVFVNLANPADALLYLVMALWGFAVYYRK